MARAPALRLGLSIALATGVGGFGFVGGARAASPTPAANAPAAASAPTAPQGSLALYLRGMFGIGRRQVTVPHRVLRVEGTEYPYVPGQWVTMRVYLRGRLIRTYELSITANGQRGSLSYAIRIPGPGHVVVSVQHAATATLGAFSASHGFTVLDDHAGFGARGPFVSLVQRRLAELHIYIPQTGVFDPGTGLALDAYHRLLGQGTSQSLDRGTVAALLDGKGRFPVRYPGDGRHAEGWISKQLLALIDGRHVAWIFPISSGKSSTPTILGRFHVYQKDPGYLPDGMYDSSFFYGGYAVHGYDPAPDFPDSHGCLRLPIPDASAAYNWLHMGDGVDVYN